MQKPGSMFHWLNKKNQWREQRETGILFFWSKIPFVDELIRKEEDLAVSFNLSPAVANKEEIGLVATDENKDIVILSQQTAGQAYVKDNLGQSNPEDKDMYSTRP